MSFVVSAALIATLVLSMTAGSFEPGLIFAIGLITLAVAVFAGAVVFRLHRSGFSKKLNDDYYAQYEKISDMLTGSVMSRTEIRGNEAGYPLVHAGGTGAGQGT